MSTSVPGLHWWSWRRARERLDQWVRTIIDDRPYAIRFGPGEGAFVDFHAREIVVDPLFTHHFTPDGVRLPQVWGVAHVDRVGMLQVLTARAQAYHEAGHVRFTDWPPLMGTTHQWLVNSLEDERMERLTAAFFPPAARDFAELGHRFWLRGMEGIGAAPDEVTILLNACLFARWDERRPVGMPSRLHLPPGAQTRWDHEIAPLVREAWIAPSCAEVSRIAKEILLLLGLDAADSSAGARRLLPRGSETRGARHGDDLPDVAPMMPVSMPHDLGPEHDAADPLLGSPMADCDPSAGVLWMQPYHALEADVRGDIERLVAELRVATPDEEPVANDRRGRFHSRSYVRSRGATPVVHAVDEADAPDGMAIMLVIDGTSSMGGNPDGLATDGGPADRHSFAYGRMPAVRRAVLHLERACARAGVPLAVGFARDQAYPSHRPSRGDPYERYRDPVEWIKRFDTPVNAEGPRALIAGMYGDAQAEAVSRSLRQVAPIIAARPEPTKLIIYIHDGEPTDETPMAVRTTVERVRRSGIGVIGLFIGDQRDLPKMQAIFGSDTIGVAAGDALAPRLGRILKRYRCR